MSRVYVGGLPADIRPDDVMYEFRRYEPLRVDLKQGFGFLEFREPRDADDAVHDMDGHRIGGRPIAVQFARGAQRRDGGGAGGGGARFDDRGPRSGYGAPPPAFGAPKKGSGYQVEVEGLDSRTSWQDLKDFARGAGNVQFADVFIRHGKKIGLIEYPSKDDVDNAVRKLDDTKLDGAVVRLYEVKKEGGSSSGGGGSGGGRGRSRSRSRSPPPRRDRSHSPRRSRSRSPRREERGGSRGDRDDRRDRSRSRSPRRERSRSPPREANSSSTGVAAAGSAGNGSTADVTAAPKSPTRD